MTKYLGVDLGTSTIKISYGKKHYLIPSLIGEVNPGWAGAAGDRSLEKNMVIIEGSDKWYVGELARLQSEIKRPLASNGQMKSAEETFLAIKAALGLIIDNEDEDIVIATGVPVATSMDIMKNLSRMLKGNIDIHLENEATNETKRLSVNIQKTLVMPEPYGTYYKVLKDRGADEAVDTVLIDIGHGSTDILTMYQGRPMRTASGSLVEAVDILTSRIAKALQEKTGQIIKPFDLMTVIKNQKETVMIGGQTYSIKGLKEHYSKQIARVIIDEVKRLISTLPPDAFIEYYIICGGGAYSFGDVIKEAIIEGKLVSSPENVIIPEDPVLSNALGFELIANKK